jgi:hypothetical protein
MNLSPLFWTLSLLAVSIILFLALASRAKARLKKQYPPIGQMVDIGGYRLHMHVEGEGTPTVILDAGAGGIGLSWELVRPAIAKVTRVVTYDRAGLGWSDPSPKPRKADVMAEELHTTIGQRKHPWQIYPCRTFPRRTRRPSVRGKISR